MLMAYPSLAFDNNFLLVGEEESEEVQALKCHGGGEVRVFEVESEREFRG